MLSYKQIKSLKHSHVGYSELEVKIIESLNRILGNIYNNFLFYSLSNKELYVLETILKSDYGFDLTRKVRNRIQVLPVCRTLMDKFYFELYVRIKNQESIFKLDEMVEYCNINAEVFDTDIMSVKDWDFDQFIMLYLYKFLDIADKPAFHYKSVLVDDVEKEIDECSESDTSILNWGVFGIACILLVLIGVYYN